jgi:transcriptional regulator with XRE-family HTH domain
MARSDQPARIGANLRAVRVQASLTQAQLAELAEVADETISRIENNRLTPSTDLIAKLARAVGVAPGQLFGLAPATTTEARSPHAKPRPGERRLLWLVRGLDDGQLEDLVRIVRLVLAIGVVPPTRRRRRSS